MFATLLNLSSTTHDPTVVASADIAFIAHLFHLESCTSFEIAHIVSAPFHIKASHQTDAVLTLLQCNVHTGLLIPPVHRVTVTFYWER